MSHLGGAVWPDMKQRRLKIVNINTRSLTVCCANGMEWYTHFLSLRQFKCLFMSVVKQGRKHHFSDLVRMCCWDRDRSQTNLIFCVSKEMPFLNQNVQKICLVKNDSSMYPGDNGAKELVVICDHVYFFHKNEWTQNCFLSPKGAGPWWKTHVTLIQEMNGQWKCVNCLWPNLSCCYVVSLLVLTEFKSA